MVDYKPDFILKIEHPLLNQDPPGNLTEIVSVEPDKGTKWRVTLQKTYDFLRVDVKCLDIKGQRISGEYMHFIPLNGGKHVTFKVSSYALENFQNASLQMRTEHFLHDGRYAFYIVQTGEEDLPFNLRVPEGNKSPSLPGYEEDDYEDTDNTMSALLRDIYSVDTHFVFGPTRTSFDTCLWAHRTILTKYPAFDVLIKQASFANPKTGMEPLRVVATKVSLATFAVLLKYIYLGKVQRHNYPDQFAISLSNQWAPTTTGGCKDAHRWHSMDLDTPLSAEPVTWKELLDAATIYKVDALRARCESALKVIDKVNITRSYDGA